MGRCEFAVEFNEKAMYEESSQDNIFKWLRKEREARHDEISMMLALKSSPPETSTFLVVMRKRTFNDALGIELVNFGGMCKVNDVTAGLVAEWNRNNLDLRILVGDWILSANGLTGYVDIRTVCKQASVLRLQISRMHAKEVVN